MKQQWQLFHPLSEHDWQQIHIGPNCRKQSDTS